MRSGRRTSLNSVCFKTAVKPGSMQTLADVLKVSPLRSKTNVRFLYRQLPATEAKKFLVTNSKSLHESPPPISASVALRTGVIGGWSPASVPERGRASPRCTIPTSQAAAAKQERTSGRDATHGHKQHDQRCSYSSSRSGSRSISSSSSSSSCCRSSRDLSSRRSERETEGLRTKLKSSEETAEQALPLPLLLLLERTARIFWASAPQ